MLFPEIRFVDANGLIAIPKVSFGEVSVGGVSNKSFIVRAPFGAEFSIGEIHSVPAGLASEFCAVVEMRGEGRYAVVSVAFSPNTVGQRAGTLVISASDFEPVEVAVHGYGLSKEFE